MSLDTNHFQCDFKMISLVLRRCANKIRFSLAHIRFKSDYREKMQNRILPQFLLRETRLSRRSLASLPSPINHFQQLVTDINISAAQNPISSSRHLPSVYFVPIAEESRFFLTRRER